MLDEAPNDFTKDGASRMLNFGIPEQQLSAMLNVVAVGAWSICSGEAVTNLKLRQCTETVVQLFLRQAYELGGADEVWKDPEDGSYHHPTFPEQQGEAWKACEQFLEEFFAMKLVEMSSRILAEWEKLGAIVQSGCALQRHEFLLLDILEEEGTEGLMRALICGPIQPNS